MTTIAASLKTADDAAIETALRTMGFENSERARLLLKSLSGHEQARDTFLDIVDALIADVSDSADPMRALLNLSHLAEASPDLQALWRRFQEQRELQRRTCHLFGFSQAMADAVIIESQLLTEILASPRPKSRPQMLREARNLIVERGSAADAEAAFERLRQFRRRETLRIALLDMDAATWRDRTNFDLVVRELSDLAQVCVRTALKLLAPGGAPFTVLGMGKLGGRELNYSSDIDLVFIHDGDSATMATLGADLLKALGQASSSGTLYRVDMRLRPDGKSGALVTPIGYALSYYESYAAAWEWQALIKTRAVAGDARLARRFRRFTQSVAWARRADDSHLLEMLRMKKKMEATSEGKDPENVKQGPGSIRDAEWIVQQLQMMVGPTHRRVRCSGMLRALDVLKQLDALTIEEERQVRQAYLFLRVLEHRLQLLNERAVRILPKDKVERAALARRMGCTARGGAAVRWLDEELLHHRERLQVITQRLFWGWQEASDDANYPTVLASTSMQRLDRISAGTDNLPTPAPLARQVRLALSPVVEHIAHAADPDRAVVNLERLCDASGNRLSLLRSLTNSPRLARAVIAILGGSSRLTDTVVRFPELLDMASQRALLERAKPFQQAVSDCRDYCFSFRDTVAALRRWKQRELLRIGLRDLAMDAPAPEVIAELANLAQACLAFACAEVGKLRRPGSQNIAFTVLGLGKLGGGEMHYNSDADVIFSYNDFAAQDNQELRSRAANEAAGWAADLIRFLGERTADGTCFQLDTRLRPDGRSGSLVRTVSGFIEYFERPVGGIAIWERQALTKARFIAGDAETAAQLRAAIQHIAFPAEWHSDWSNELRHIKQRIEKERATKSTTSGKFFDVKLGNGALNDIEFCAQWLVLKYGHRYPDLQRTNTLHQIEAARSVELLNKEDAEKLIAAYLFLRRAELRLQVTQENAAGAVARDNLQWTAWARAVFPNVDDAEDLFESEWDRHTKAARKVMEEVRDKL